MTSVLFWCYIYIYIYIYVCVCIYIILLSNFSCTCWPLVTLIALKNLNSNFDSKKKEKKIITVHCVGQTF